MSLLEGDVAQAVRALEQQDRPELQVHGSLDLLQSLHGTGVAAEYRVLTFPVVLGGGRRLFADGAPARALRLVASTSTSLGVVLSVYAPAGEVVTGTFAPE